MTKEIKKNKKMGRPTDNPRNQRISLKITTDEMETLNKCSELMNEPRVNVIVKGIELVKKELENRLGE